MGSLSPLKSGRFSDAYAVSHNTFVELLSRWTSSAWKQVYLLVFQTLSGRFAGLYIPLFGWGDRAHSAGVYFGSVCGSCTVFDGVGFVLWCRANKNYVLTAASDTDYHANGVPVSCSVM